MDPNPPNLFGLRPLLPNSGSHKGTRDCEADGCRKSTREGKPYCSKHIENAPYIKSIQAQLDQRDAEELVLEKGRRLISKDGFFVREAVLLLRTKDFTVKSFSRRLDISHKAAGRLIELLVRWKLAKEVKTSRGGKTISGLRTKDLVDGI
jgi:hypothetical protein